MLDHSSAFRLWFTPTLLVVIGCSGAPEAVAPVVPAQPMPAAPLPTTPIMVEGKRLSFDPKTCTRGEAGFDWSLGSVRVKVLGHKKEHCLFDFTEEVEGGYTVYRCRVPLDSGPVTIEEGTVQNGESTATGIVTSFVKGDHIVRRGNFFDGWQDVLVEKTNHYVSIQPEGGQAGPPVPPGAKLVLRFRIYADDSFAAYADGAKQRQEVTTVLGEPHEWKWVAPAVEGITLGERRRLRIHSRIAGGAKEWQPTLLDGQSLYLEMELISATGP